MDLAPFMELVGATLQDVADATGLDISTVSRIRSRKTKNPRGKALLLIKRWADEVAKQKRLRASERLSLEDMPTTDPTPSGVEEQGASEPTERVDVA